MERKHDIIEVSVVIKHETEKAILIGEGDKDIWLPKSTCEIDERKADGSAIISMPEWLAIDKGLV